MLFAKFQFFPWCGLRYRGPKFFRFPIWRPHHVAYDVILIIKTFHISRCTNGENLVSIRLEVAGKNMKVLCRQTDRHRQANGLKCNSLSFVEGKHCFRCGSREHLADICKHARPTCSSCRREGHLVKVCLKKQNVKRFRNKPITFSPPVMSQSTKRIRCI